MRLIVITPDSNKNESGVIFFVYNFYFMLGNLAGLSYIFR